MICARCGKRTPDDSRFCQRCGAPIAAATPPQANSAATDEPLFIVRQRFSCGYLFLQLAISGPFLAFGGTIFLFFLGGPLFWAIEMTGVELTLSMRIGMGVVLFGVVLPIGLAIFHKKAYARTEYRFYRDRLEYSRGVWALKDKTLAYDKIAEATVRRGPIQKRFGLGTLFLSTPAARGGLELADIENPEAASEAVRALTEKRSAATQR